MCDNDVCVCVMCGGCGGGHTCTHVRCLFIMVLIYNTQLLLACGAPLFAKNIAKQTPLDAAVKAKQSIIANFLESKMVFSVSMCPSCMCVS